VGYKSLTVNINVKLFNYLCVEHGLMMVARSGRIINRKSSLSPRLLSVIKLFNG